MVFFRAMKLFDAGSGAKIMFDFMKNRYSANMLSVFIQAACSQFNHAKDSVDSGKTGLLFLASMLIPINAQTPWVHTAWLDYCLLQDKALDCLGNCIEKYVKPELSCSEWWEKWEARE